MAKKLMVVIKIAIFIFSSATSYLFISIDLDVMVEKIKLSDFWIELTGSLLFGVVMVIIYSKRFLKVLNRKDQDQFVSRN